jgi:hypothetical protein
VGSKFWTTTSTSPRSGASRTVSRGPDVDAPDLVETVDLPGADLSGEELVVTVEPMRSHEFRCTRCFLVQSRHLVGEDRRGTLVCRDCTG